ncbi:MAG TPA: hypothetical protein HA282_00535 [Nanoarchaeota archaeon]|nr:hypothetical protein [Candidatus Pacearchaeota archaeon]HIH17734.1 hypothetical protein [Nanoarchaeota archaeon]HIH33798.1 hypothetical protein [Nanoarchaeota archaeon]HIH51623.1 hypothetical protein [Nanoarchaeota archaeon]HIH65688.1 hypothetical protein [Nanoarchaeota archaeon]
MKHGFDLEKELLRHEDAEWKKTEISARIKGSLIGLSIGVINGAIWASYSGPTPATDINVPPEYVFDAIILCTSSLIGGLGGFKIGGIIGEKAYLKKYLDRYRLPNSTQ